jgi:hypothetical protein
MAPAAVAAIAEQRIAAMAQTLGVAATPVGLPLQLHAITMDRLSELEANSVLPESPSEASRIAWVVRAVGTFVGLRGPSPDPIVFGSGYLLIDDLTGEVIAMGMP